MPSTNITLSVSQSLASYLDLNDLYALSSTCHAIHSTIIQFARHLRRESLRCVNDEPLTHLETLASDGSFQIGGGKALEELEIAEDSFDNQTPYSMALPISGAVSSGRYLSPLGLSGKVSRCARDLVAPCRRCGVVVCRNCTIKPPPARCFAERFRRLCKTCLEASFGDHLQRFRENGEYSDTTSASSTSSARSLRSLSSGSSQSLDDIDCGRGHDPFPAVAFLRTACECELQGVYLCQPCGQSLCSANTTYRRVWTWRSRYSTHIGGGLGTGLGQGEQGQKCGRGEHCLETSAAGICWVEIDCSETETQVTASVDQFGISRSSTPLLSDRDTRMIRNKPGYFSQEIEGIGGVVKKKVKKRVKVGATVYEYDDERESGKYLAREASGRQRSWCGWCFRVCPGEGDHENAHSLLRTQRP